MKTLKGLFVAALTLCAVISLPASAQSTVCAPQVNCMLTVGQNLAVDSDFESGCPAWYFGAGSKREAPGPCSSTYCPKTDALMTALSTSTATYFQQDINLAPTGCQLRPYSLTFYIHVAATSTNTSDKVVIEVVNPYTGALLQTVGVYDSRTLHNWDYQQISLSPSFTSTWPQWVRLRFRGTFATGSSTQFRFDEIKFWGI